MKKKGGEKGDEGSVRRKEWRETVRQGEEEKKCHYILRIISMNYIENVKNLKI